MGKKLSINAMKTQSLLISSKHKHTILRNQNLRLSLKIMDHELEVVTTTNYLGLQIDNSLDWKRHVSALSSKVSMGVVSIHDRGEGRREKCGVTEKTSCSGWGTKQIFQLRGWGKRLLFNY